MKQPLGWRRVAGIVVATVLTLAVSAGIGSAVIAVGREISPPGPPAPPATADPFARTLGLPTAAAVFDSYQTARDGKDVAGFSSSTCESFVSADMARRGVKSVADLLAAYERALKYVPVQIVENPVAKSAGNDGDNGWVKVEATITDNRFVPPKTERRTVQIAMHFETDRWKLCPSLDPL